MNKNFAPLLSLDEYRFTLLHYVTDPMAVTVLWCVFCVCLFCMMVGLWPRLMTVASVLLLFSFHERNLQPLGGGDTVLRNIGFILMIAPELGAFSVSRLEHHWKHWNKTGEFLAPLTTQVWPYRLLLWQIMIIYLTSGWDKLQGEMWLDGTVVEAVFHHTHFVRYSMETMNRFLWISPFASFYTLIFEFGWFFLLVPRNFWSVLPRWVRKHSFKRFLICGSLLFHWGIFVFMDVGSFPFAMTVAYAGLLLDSDFEAFLRMGNRFFKGKILMFYDSMCLFCTRSTFAILMLDQLGRVQAIDFRNVKLRTKYAPDVAEKDLDRSMHIKVPGDGYYKGFDGFRVLAWRLPLTRILTPFLYVPGIPVIGRRIYTQIAENRKKCAGGACIHKS